MNILYRFRPHFGSYAMQGNCYCYCYRQSQRTENAQYQHIIAKWQKVAVSKMPYFAPFSSHFSALFQPVFGENARQTTAGALAETMKKMKNKCKRLSQHKN